MSPLGKRYPRSIRHNLGRYIGLLILLMMAVGLGNGYMQAAQNNIDMMSGMREKYSVEDGRFMTDFEAKADAIKDVEALGCTVHENFSYDASLTIPGRTIDDTTVRLYGDREGFDEVSYTDGRAPEADGEVALDRVFMQNNKLSLGDTVEFDGKTFTICGIVSLPDYVTLFENNSDTVYDALTFGVGQVTSGARDALAKGDQTFTYSFSFGDRDLSLADRVSLEKRMVDVLIDHGVSVSDMIDHEYNQGISYATGDNEGDLNTALTLTIILTIVLSFIFVLLTNATIEQESSAIGTLLSMGYTKGELVRHYLTLPMIVGAVGCLLGLGYAILVEDTIRQSYYNTYSLPPYVRGFHPDIYLKTVLVPLVLLFVILLAGLLLKLRLTPLQFLRGEVRGSRGAKKESSLPEGMSYVQRFRLRVFLRNTSSFVILFIGILVANTLLLFSLSVMPSVRSYAVELKRGIPAEHVYTLKDELRIDGTADERAAWAAIEEITTNEKYAGIDLDLIEDVANDLRAAGSSFRDFDKDAIGALALMSNLTKADVDDSDELRMLMRAYGVDDFTDLADTNFHKLFVAVMARQGVHLSDATDGQLTTLLEHARELSKQIAPLTDDERKDFGNLIVDVSKVDNFDIAVNPAQMSQATIDQAEPFAVTRLECGRALDDSNETVTIYGIQEGSAYYPDIDVSGGRIVADPGLLEKCGITLGEPATFTDRTTGDAYDITIDGATALAASTNVYMSIDTFNQMFGNDEGYFNGYFSNEALDLNRRYLVSDYTPADADKIADQLEDSYGDIMNVITWLSIPIFIIVIYLLTKTLIDRSARSIAYMKVFGYKNSEIDMLYLRSITVGVVISLFVSVPILRELIGVVYRFMLAAQNGNYVYTLTLQIVVIDLVIALITYLVVALLHMRHIKKVPLSLALKVVE
ncbi:ABC-type antimicrobial peptide transport system permease subunit [Olsenella profusa DSM 13989]|uniref:FtsX-like permease family protein n=1 Tax=Olsenella profusa TaxID=138595 RepID=UPI00277F43AC|nr:FtsX-like permease family protein [Olsenella profusa]MDP9859075.1 ABC-type antimicrobial peptide transport system permease subunit [Olsenella profusa DSM 13989]